MGFLDATEYVERVELIDPEALKTAGIRALLLDRDNTCVPRDASCAPDSVVKWLEDVRAAGIATCMVSNNTHVKDVSRSASELGCDYEAAAFKPLPFAIKRALRHLGVPPQQACMVGDQLFTDVIAGNAAGVRTILVLPQCREDLWYTNLLFRVPERKLLKDVTFRGTRG
jgi:hypothetical protein